MCPDLVSIKSMREAYDELYLYPIEHGDPLFILQHVVDAYGTQTAGEDAKPRGFAFCLVGLYLRVKKGYTG